MKQFNISEDEMDRMLHIARQAQDLDLIEKLKAKQGFYPRPFKSENLRRIHPLVEIWQSRTS